MTTLIVGGLGFIGKNLLDTLLKKKEECVVLDNLSLGTMENKYNDIPVYSNSNRFYIDFIMRNHHIDKVYYLGGHSSAPMFKVSKVMMEDLNTFRMILDNAVRNKAKVVYATTSSLINGVPHTQYEGTKLMMENMATIYKNEFGLKIMGARLFSVYGPREEHKGKYANVVSQFIWKMLNDEQPVIYSDGKQTRDFIYVDDVIRGVLYIMEKGKTGEIHNLGTGISTSFNELIQYINNLMEKNIKPIYITNPIKNYVLKTKAKPDTKVGWFPGISLSNGITKTIEYYDRY